MRLRVVSSLLGLAELSSGEKTVSLVSGVPSCLYESPPALDEWGEDGLNAASRACAIVMVRVAGSVLVVAALGTFLTVLVDVRDEEVDDRDATTDRTWRETERNEDESRRQVWIGEGT